MYMIKMLTLFSLKVLDRVLESIGDIFFFLLKFENTKSSPRYRFFVDVLKLSLLQKGDQCDSGTFGSLNPFWGNGLKISVKKRCNIFKAKRSSDAFYCIYLYIPFWYIAHKVFSAETLDRLEYFK